MTRPNMLKNITNDLMGRLPLLELAGDHRVIIENHNGVLGYSLNEILIKVTYGRLSVIGENLRILQMSKDQLVITGSIDEICLFRR